MYLTSPDHIPKLPGIPDTLAIHEFLFQDVHGRHPIATSKPPFTCGIMGRSYSALEVKHRIEFLARALSIELGWQVNKGTEMDKAVGIFSLNTIDTLTVSWAAHRLNGVSCPSSPLHTTESLVQLLKATRCKALFTSAPLITTALEAAALVGIPDRHVFVLEVPEVASKGIQKPAHLKTVDQLISEGSRTDPLPSLQWSVGQGIRQTAFLVSSSGTTGFPKNVRITHQNVIASILHFDTFESSYRNLEPQMVLNVLPLSHMMALVPIAQLCIYRGDGVIMMQGFDLQQSLSAIEKYKVETLWMTPTLVFAFTEAASIVKTYDLSSVKGIRVGAAALDRGTLECFEDILPGRDMIQGYGLTETTAIVAATHPDDVVFGSCGYPLPGFELCIVDPDDNKVIYGHDHPGELLIRGGSIVPGYYGDEKASKEMLTDDGWLRTGDLAEFRKSPKGFSHLFIIDRIKELIKVQDLQVAPAEIEAFLRLNRLVSDITIVPLPRDLVGEVPRAYVVKSSAAEGLEDQKIQDALHEAVNEKFPQYKRLTGGIAFVSTLPRTASGKVRRDLVRKMARDHYDAEKNTRELEALRASVQVFNYDTDDEDED